MSLLTKFGKARKACRGLRSPLENVRHLRGPGQPIDNKEGELVDWIRSNAYPLYAFHLEHVIENCASNEKGSKQ